MGQKQPEISVVTPSFNQGSFIEEAIQSVLAQGRNYCEHIVIDGGSTDHTLDILKQYPHLKWISEPDEGQSDALNKGFGIAKGDWILWLNADDVLLPGALKKMSDRIQEGLLADVIHGHVLFFRNGEKTIFKAQYFAGFNHLNTIFRIVTPPSTGTLFRSEILKNHPLNKEFHYMMDTEWYMRCGKNLKIKIINDFLVKFRISENNKTASQILTGSLNHQQEKEQRILYGTYALPYLKSLPRVLHKPAFRTLNTILLTINRIKKIKYYLHARKSISWNKNGK